MSNPVCARREAYLDRRLSRAEAIAFEAHLASCPECGPLVTAWRQTGQRLDHWAAPFDGEPTPHQLRAFRAKLEAPPRRVAWLVPVVSLAAVVVLGLITWKVLAPPPVDTPSGEWAVTFDDGHQVSSADGVAALGSETRDQRVRVGPDSLTVVKATRLELIEKSTRRTRLRLTQGSVAAQVEPGHAGRSFIIESAPFRLTVVGTEFVARRVGDTFGVTTLEGLVRVERLAGEGVVETRLVPAGATVELVEVAAPSDTEVPVALDAGSSEPLVAPRRAVAGPTARELAAWRTRAARGQCAEVIEEADEALKRSPKNVGVLRVLADCHRKQGDSQTAIAMYKKVIGLASGNDAGEAMLLAVALLEDEHGDAATVLDLTASLGSMRGLSAALAGPLHIRRARALKVTGRLAEARAEVEWVLSRYPGTPAAADAQRLKSDLR